MSGKAPADGSRYAAGMSVTETSEAIGLSRPTILRRLRAGKWPGGKSGRKWLVSAPFVLAATSGLRVSPQFDVEEFAAEWMARGSSPELAHEVMA